MMTSLTVSYTVSWMSTIRGEVQSSQLIPVQLYLELPFWLMMPEGEFEVKHGEDKLKFTIVHACEEIQITTTHMKSRISTAFIA